ncbi:MAG: hypothetical protein ABIR90_04300 [Sphingomicrobium sp.]
MKRNTAFVLGLAATCAATLVWHGPGGAGDRLTASLSREVRVMLDNYEMGAIHQVGGSPLDRRVLLAGPADDFQRTEIKRLTETLPGVSAAQWVDSPVRGRHLPLLAEAIFLSLACFASGLILAYLVALRSRARDTSRL